MAKVETAEPPEVATFSKPSNPKPEDLVARAIAPVKPEYLRPPPLRPNGSDEGAAGNDKGASRKGPDNGAGWKSVIAQKKKSKRQLKRERQQERKSAKNICPDIARTSDVNSCRYGGTCRLSHDLEGFLQQKPEDLPGTCPFVQFGESCPYGVACRFYGTHGESMKSSESRVSEKSSEVNGLSKDLQKLLWKNKFKFPNADTQLKLLGLSGGKGAKKMGEKDYAKERDTDNLNGSGLPKQKENDEIEPTDTFPSSVYSPDVNSKEDFVNDTSSVSDLRSSKRVRAPDDEVLDTNDTEHGISSVEGKDAKDMEENSGTKEKDTDNLNGSGFPPKNEKDEIEPTETLPDSVYSPTVSLKANLVNDTSSVSDLRPSKKVRAPVDEVLDANETVNGTSPVEGNIVKYLQTECENASDTSHSTRTEVSPKLSVREKKIIDFREKLYLAPLTTVGNLPFRRVCKILGADVTCGEMAMCTNLLQGQASEWALLRRHSSEDFFGVQICGSYPDTVARTIELIGSACDVDFVDINMGCPIDVVVNKGAGSFLLTKPTRMKSIIQAACGTMDKPLTVKVRTGYFEGRNRIDSLVSDISDWGATAVTIHGRSRQQRYSKLADWDYIYNCARKAPDTLQVMGNGDIFSYLDWNKHTSDCPQLSTCVIARGALIKPWIFTEIKEQRHWDITSAERFDILKKYVNFGLQHWGSDSKGVETTRHFLLEWLSYTCRYIPVGLLDVVPQRLNWRPPSYYGRDDLETLMASESAADWIRISEMLLGKVPDGFSFAPKHKSNAYDGAENG